MYRTKTTSQLIKEKNINEIFQIIRDEKAISRVEIAKKMKLSQTSVGRSVSELMDAGYVVEGENVGNSVGRQRIQLRIVPDRALALGIYLQRQSIDAGLVDVNGNLIRKSSFMFAETKQTDIVENVSEVIDSILSSLSDQILSHLVGIGITIPGASINYREGIILHSEELGVASFHLGSRLQAVYPYTIIIDTDVNSEAKAQKFLNSVENPDEFIVIHLGTGISLAQTINGKIARGAHNCSGELGHIITETNGVLCECGRRGCLQTVIGRRGIEKQLGISFSDAVKRYHENDRDCQYLLNRAVHQISVWLANMIHLYDPREVILTGSMIDEWEEMFDMIVRNAKRYTGNYFTYDYSVKRPLLRGIDNHIVVAASNIFYKFSIKNNENYYDFSR